MKKILLVSALTIIMTTPTLPSQARVILNCNFTPSGCGGGSYGGSYGGSGGGYGGYGGSGGGYGGSGSGSSSGGKSGGSDAGQCVYTCTSENGVEVCRGNGPQCNDIDPYERDRTNEKRRPNRRDRTDGGNP